jgi:hypothetical protein
MKSFKKKFFGAAEPVPAVQTQFYCETLLNCIVAQSNGCQSGPRSRGLPAPSCNSQRMERKGECIYISHLVTYFGVIRTMTTFCWKRRHFFYQLTCT